MTIRTDLPWHADHSELVSFARILVDDAILNGVEDVLDYFEKPWHWDEEHAIYAAAEAGVKALRTTYGTPPSLDEQEAVEAAFREALAERGDL